MLEDRIVAELGFCRVMVFIHSYVLVATIEAEELLLIGRFDVDGSVQFVAQYRDAYFQEGDLGNNNNNFYFTVGNNTIAWLRHYRSREYNI
jgi:hypothetical protein